MISRTELCNLLEAFIRGDDRSLDAAGRLEVALDEQFGDQQPFADLCLALASYRPGGGPYLYDETRILPMMKQALEELAKLNEPKAP